TRTNGGRYSPLPAVVRESFIGFRHAVDVVFFLDGAAAQIGRVVQLIGQLLGHALFRAGARVLQDPANRQAGSAIVGNFYRHLIVGAADATRLDFEQRLAVLHGLLEELQRIILRTILDLVHGRVENLLG